MTDKRSTNNWIERNGGPESITPRFCEFLEKQMGGLSLDLSGDKETRPDYLCLGESIVVEVKSLEGDPTERLENAIEPAKELESWPKFYGEWPIESVIKNLPEEERAPLQKKLFDRLARAIITHLKKANRQLEHFSRNRTNTHLRLLVLINEDFVEYDPHTVSTIIQRELARTKTNGEAKYTDIDAALYLTERHATQTQGLVTFPIVLIHSPETAQNKIALELLRRMMERWAIWSSGIGTIKTHPSLNEFDAIIDNPRSMKRHELWRREYKQRPYMRKWTDEEVIGLWDSASLMSFLAFHISPPVNIPPEGETEVMEKTTHLMEEFANRGITMDQLKPTKERINSAIENISLGSTVQEWLHMRLRHIE